MYSNSSPVLPAADKPFAWSGPKDEWLRAERGVGFEQVVAAIRAGGLLDVAVRSGPSRHASQGPIGMSVMKKDRKKKSVHSTDGLQEERETLAAYERGEFVSQGLGPQAEPLRAAARATPPKDQRINIRLATADLREIQLRAGEEGLPYQTLIASVLHKYATGRLVDLPRSKRPRDS